MLATLSPEDLFKHLLVFGSTGCGKTRNVILPLLAQVLGRDAGDPKRRAGALIFDVKGDMPDHVQAVMKAAGRDDEIITIGRGGNAWFDPFAGIGHDSRAVAERLIEMVRGQAGDHTMIFGARTTGGFCRWRPWWPEHVDSGIWAGSRESLMPSN